MTLLWWKAHAAGWVGGLAFLALVGAPTAWQTWGLVALAAWANVQAVRALRRQAA